MSDDRKYADPWVVDWAVNCPYCDYCIEGIQEDDFLQKLECGKCGQVFVVNKAYWGVER